MVFVMSFYISIHHYICFNKNIFVQRNMSLNRSINLLISNFFRVKKNCVFLFLWRFKNIRNVRHMLFWEFRKVTVKVVLKEVGQIKQNFRCSCQYGCLQPNNNSTSLVKIVLGSTNCTFSGAQDKFEWYWAIGPLLSFISVWNMI